MFKLSKHLGLEVSEARLTRNQLYQADEAFFTGTAAEITPIREVDGRAIGEGKQGEVTRRLMDAFEGAVRGKLEGFEDWLTYVD